MQREEVRSTLFYLERVVQEGGMLSLPPIHREMKFRIKKDSSPIILYSEKEEVSTPTPIHNGTMKRRGVIVTI
jgi:hypothetical protein